MIKRFKVNGIVSIGSEFRDNYNVNPFQKFRVLSIATNTREHGGFDDIGQALYDLWDIKNNTYFNSSLYDYELEHS